MLAIGYLVGLKEYLDEFYEKSIFDQTLASKEAYELHLYGHRVITAEILENLSYDLKVAIDGQRREEIPKIKVKLLYPAELAG